MISFLYRALTDLGAPAIGFYLWRRKRRGREDTARFAERLGYASQTRPVGRLIWCHAASVGEAASLLALIERLGQKYPATHILITTGTVASARMLAARLPPKVIHQYMPVDRAAYVTRFLNYWQPDFALWIESELWPNMLYAIHTRNIPAALINARMSEKSFRNWSRVKSWARKVLSGFVICLAQTEEDRAHFVALGAKAVRCVGNLKYAANPLPCDENELAKIQKTLAGRPCWLMASTHPGEEDIALDTHRDLRAKYPGLLTIIVPRHAVRGDEIARSIEGAGLPYIRRSKGEVITPQTEIYLGDTMGELGFFYRFCPVICLAGSFTWSGHNPIEAAQLDCAIVFGPAMKNFSEIAREFLHEQAALQVQSAHELSAIVEQLLTDAAARARLARNARALADRKKHVLDQILDALEPWMDRLTV